MRTLFLSVLILLSVVSLPLSPAYAADDASSYIQALGDNALAVITNTSYNKDQKQAELEKIFSSNVDFPWVARFVMGRFWREATDDQKARYVTAYQKFLILHYTSRFTDYTSGSFKVSGSKDDGDSEFTVSTQMQADQPNAQPVMVDYRVRQSGTGKKATYKIFDVIVEGVSLITTQRSEFASVLTKNGIDYLIDELTTKSKNGDTSTADKS